MARLPAVPGGRGPLEEMDQLLVHAGCVGGCFVSQQKQTSSIGADLRRGCDLPDRVAKSPRVPFRVAKVFRVCGTTGPDGPVIPLNEIYDKFYDLLPEQFKVICSVRAFGLL